MILPISSMAMATSLWTSDPGAVETIAAISTAGCYAYPDVLNDNSFSANSPIIQSIPTLSLSSLDKSLAPQEILENIHTLDDAFNLVSTTLSRVLEILASTKTSDFEIILDNPVTVLSTIALVTASDMVPFVPCQPLAISLGAKYGAFAFPICVVGQTLAGVFAFQSSRTVSDAKHVQTVLESLGEKGQVSFQKFQTESLLGKDDEEKTVFLALVGLRLAPFFPFSAGNYLLGGATDVGLRPFVLATILGCMVSNAISVLLGMGGAELFQTVAIH